MLTPLEGLTNNQFVSIAGEISPQQQIAASVNDGAVRLVFVDGRYVSALSDATEGSGMKWTLTTTVRGTRRYSGGSVSAFDGKPGTKRDAYRREARSTAGKAIAVNAYYPGRGR